MGRDGRPLPHPLGIGLPSQAHLEAPALELAVLLAEGAGPTKEVDAAVGAGLLREPVGPPQLVPVEAGVESHAHPCGHAQQQVQRPARTAR